MFHKCQKNICGFPNPEFHPDQEYALTFGFGGVLGDLKFLLITATESVNMPGCLDLPEFFLGYQGSQEG